LRIEADWDASNSDFSIMDYCHEELDGGDVIHAEQEIGFSVEPVAIRPAAFGE